MRVRSVTLFAAGVPIRVNTYYFDEGDEIPPHTHDFAHASLSVVGDFEVFDWQGRTAALDEGSYAEFPAGKEHGLRARGAGGVLVAVNEAGQTNGH